MHAFRSFLRYKFPPRQSAVMIGAPIAAAFIANRLAVAARWSDAGVNAIGLTAAVAVLIALHIVFYRRARA